MSLLGEYCGDDSIVMNCPLPKVGSISMVAEEKGIFYKVKFPYRCFDELVKKEELSEKMFDFYKKINKKRLTILKKCDIL